MTDLRITARSILCNVMSEQKQNLMHFTKFRTIIISPWCPPLSTATSVLCLAGTERL